MATETVDEVSLLPQDLNTTNLVLSSILDVSEELSITVDEVHLLCLYLNCIFLGDEHCCVLRTNQGLRNDNCQLYLSSMQSVIEIFDNVLDDSNSNGWHGLQMVSSNHYYTMLLLNFCRILPMVVMIKIVSLIEWCWKSSPPGQRRTLWPSPCKESQWYRQSPLKTKHRLED